MSHTVNKVECSFPPPLVILLHVCAFIYLFPTKIHPFLFIHPPQVVCSVLSSTVWINDWCFRPQVKVRKVHYWIISALLSLLPSAWLLLVDAVEALEGTLSANALKKLSLFAFQEYPVHFFFTCKDVVSKSNQHNVNLHVRRHVCTLTHAHSAHCSCLAIREWIMNHNICAFSQPLFHLPLF